MLKGILSSLGLGQSDLVHVFTKTLERLNRIDIQNEDRRVGQAQAIQAMIEVLREEDVMSSSTARQLFEELDLWIQGGPKRKRK